MPVTEERVSKLEIVLEEFVKNVGIEFNKLYNSQLRTEAELREFKQSIEEFKQNMEIEYKKLYDSQMKTEAGLREFKNEMKEFKDEMKMFKDEMKVFKDRMDEETRKKNREWSNLAKKMGTLVEDLIAPALRPTLSKYFGCDVTMEGQRMFRRKEGENYEIDAIALCDDMVFMVEVKATPRLAHIEEIKEKGERFFEFFPEHKGKRLFIIFGSITFPEDVIREASKQRLYVMGWREWEYMDILNFDDIKGHHTF